MWLPNFLLPQDLGLAVVLGYTEPYNLDIHSPVQFVQLAILFTLSTGEPDLVTRLISTWVLFVGLSVSCQARHLYDFVESDTGDVLATLELARLPAIHLDVVSLKFTPQGLAFQPFGEVFGPVYDGDFDVISRQAVGEIFPRNLGCSDCTRATSTIITDGDHPTLRSFSLRFNNRTGADRMFISSPLIDFGPSGDWLRQVPEPTACNLFSTAALVGLGLVHRCRSQA